MGRTIEREEMSKHTPGPWNVESAGSIFDIWADRLTGSGMVAEVLNIESNGMNAGEANARLIAASPEMFKELDRIANWNLDVRPGHVDYRNRQSVKDAAASLIAKAKGE